MTPPEAPMRRAGKRAGYEGRAEYVMAEQRLRRALAQLAREVDPAARLAGAQLVAAATAILDELADRAEQASPTLRRRRARDARVLDRLDRLAAARSDRPSDGAGR
jgi:hypothetical protein